MLEDHHNASSYDGCVRDIYSDIVQQSSGGKEDNATTSGSEVDRVPTNATTEVQVFGLDKGVHFSALGVTIAVGCSLLMLNAVVFGAIFYQKDKINVAKNMQKAFYEVKRSSEEEENDSFKKPYLLKDAPSSLILHDFEVGGFGGKEQIFDLVESSELKRQLSDTTTTELTSAARHHHKVKTVTFVEAPTILCEAVCVDVLQSSVANAEDNREVQS